MASPEEMAERFLIPFAATVLGVMVATVAVRFAEPLIAARAVEARVQFI